MLESVKNIFVVKDIRKKILYTILIIILFRIGTFITVPGMNKVAFLSAVNTTSNGIMGTINIISGGAFNRFSIFAMTKSGFVSELLLRKAR